MLNKDLLQAKNADLMKKLSEAIKNDDENSISGIC